MLIFRNDFCVVFLHEIVLSQQFVLAIFAIESNFSDLLSAKALETSLCRMWGSGHYNIGSAIFASKLLFVRLTGSLALNYAQFFG